jgi:hypothetical protein
MAPVTVTIVTHLKKKKPPAWTKLKIVLTEVVKAIYGQDAKLVLDRGSIGDSEFENMVHFHSSLNPGIRHHVEGILDRKFGPHFIVGYNGELEGHRTVELDEAERRIDERLKNERYSRA